VAKFQGGSFQAIQEYFQQKFCRNCANLFSSEGIQLLRQEPGVLVVRVTCQSCGHPLGVAIVGCAPERTAKKTNLPLDWTRRDVERLKSQAPISYDDLLLAHEFFAGLGADWTKHLPRTGNAAAS
jgi:hypothetical protein